MTPWSALVLAQVAVSLQPVGPVLEFPEPAVDDSAAYEGYRTRFLRDAAGNTVQIYINQRDGRVVHLWADATNASVGMTVRGVGGMPARLTWGRPEARIGMAGDQRVVAYELIADAGPLEIGAFVLGSMRLERDFQYGRGHLAAFEAARAEQPELHELIGRLERLPQGERERHLAALRASSTGVLRSRLQPTLQQGGAEIGRIIRIEQPTFDGRNSMSLELTFENADATLDPLRRMVAVRPRDGAPVRIGVRIETDAPVLVPLDGDQIFNPEFLQFGTRLERAATTPEAAARLRRMRRQIRSLELVSSEQKLMAGLPNYATYFGRDMLMSALMLEPIWTSDMIEHVLASVLRKLNAAGAVSHEEALGGQAIRENAVLYNALIDEALQSTGPRADSLLAEAHTVIGHLQAVRENYHMVDDDFQLAVLAGRYLASRAVPPERRRAFLLAGDDGVPGSRLERLLRNLAFVARAAAPYARAPVPANLIGFAYRGDGRWAPGSWRDSGAGYGNGRFAMDVNVIWVPQALESIGRILTALDSLDLRTEAPAVDSGRHELEALLRHARDRAGLNAAITTWRGARRHFEVELDAGQARAQARAALAALPVPERDFWQARLDSSATESMDLAFLAVALDSAGRPIPVVNTDPAMRLFLEDPDSLAARAGQTLRDLDALVMPYPLGLFVPELGPLVANDVYAAAPVRAAFREDLYHSPRVVWGREVNLLMLGLARNITAAYDSTGRLRDGYPADYVGRLRDALARIAGAVDASGLKHNELWSYRIEDGRLLPVRYGASTDIQLWNLTDLAVQFALARIPAAAAGAGGGPR